MKRYLPPCVLVLILGWANEAIADIITGPTLNQNATDMYTGLMFTATVNSYMLSFIYQNQGAADQVELGLVSTNPANGALYVSSVVGTISVPSNTPSFIASNLNWQMGAGSTYVLVGEMSNNAKFAFYSSYPTSDGQISISTGVFSADLVSIATQTDAWGGFNNIDTVSTPEPSSFFLAILSAVTGFVGWRGARRKKAAANPAAACA
jgi:hypothetical protein